MTRAALYCVLMLAIAIGSGCDPDRERSAASRTNSNQSPSTSENPAAKRPSIPTDTDWTTAFERSDGKRTPRYAETVAYCRKVAAASPMVKLTEFGQSPQGRALPLVIVDKRGRFSPDEVRNTDNAVILIEACIHAGESAGKDAGLMLLRDLTVTQKLTGLLDHVTVLFIPIFNVDGHERFGPHNRINQNGPEEMGYRTNARNLNLNRDFLKADTVEMRAWLKLYNAWLPEFFVDMHSTDGADYQYPLTYGLELSGNMHPDLTEWTRAYIEGLKAPMAQAGFPIFPYVMFKNWHDPRSGLISGAAGPRYSQGYTAIQNRPGLLIETHMLKDYKTRVMASFEMLKLTLEMLNRDHRELARLAGRADSETAAASFRQQPYALKYKATDKSRPVAFDGVEYEVVKSDVTGGQWFRYSDKPATFEVQHFYDVQPTSTAKLPEAYIIPPQWIEVIERLELHGVKLRRLVKPMDIAVRQLRFEEVEFKAESAWQGLPFEGRHLVSYKTKPQGGTRRFPAGSVVVDMAQRTARVIAHLLEPDGPDSLVHWGFFNTIFQRTEYVESYVIEQMARDMLAENPELKKEFERAFAGVPAKARNPGIIRDWFYKRTPYHDNQHNLYPVAMVDDRRELDRLPLD